MTASNVVLPAPLAPIRPTISPSPTANVTPSNARTPPKLLLTLDTRSMLLRPRGRQLGKPFRQKSNKDNQKNAQKNEVELRCIGPEEFGEQRERHGAEDRAEEIIGTADDRHGDHRKR